MYKVMLVDDEPIVREGVKERIDWAKLGLVCAADCGDGWEAMEAADRVKPDIVVTDINMPLVDGLGLARHLAERHPAAKVIILTGYDDFNYAQQAVKLRVKDFILKPITAAELTAVLQRTKEELDEERRKLEDLDRLRQGLNESLPLLKERFLEKLASSSVHPREREERLAYFRLDLPGPFYAALAADIDQFPESYAEADKELLRYALFNMMQEVLSEEGQAAAFRSRDEKVVAVLSGGSPGTLCDKAQYIAEKVRRLAEAYFKFTLTVGIGRCFEGLQDLPRAYRSALAALEYRFLLGTNQVISISDMEEEDETSDAVAERERRIVSSIKTGTEADLREALCAVVHSLRSSHPSMEQCYLQLQKLIVSVSHAMNELGLADEEVFGGAANPLTRIYDFRTLDDAEAWLFDCCRNALRRLADRRSDYQDQQVQAAIDFIKRQYGDETLSLAKVCGHVHLSASYFSAVFKAKTGKTFVEYLTAERIERAKELLKTSSLKAYEIAERVGYRDPHYFSALFKKATGDTPTEFRHKCAPETT